MAESEKFTDKTFEAQRDASVAPTKTIGHGGFAIFGGYIQDREKNRDLSGITKYKTFAEILANVSIVAAGVRHMLNLIGKASWTVEPAEEGGAEGERIAELVESALYDMATPLPKVVKRSAVHRLYGFSIQEWTAKKRPDGVIGFKDLEPRAQFTIERWDVDLSGTVHGVEQISPQTGRAIYIPRSKLVYCVDDTLTDSPEGMGILRHVAPIVSRLQRYEQLEGFGLESDLRGIPVGRAPYALLQDAVNRNKLTKEQMAEILRPIETLISNHIKHPALGLVLDSMVYASKDEAATPSGTYQYGLDLLKSGSTSQAECAAVISRLCREIAYLLGIEGMLLGTGDGSYALAKDKSGMFKLLVDGGLTDVAYALERDFIGPMFALNGWDPKYKPTLIPEKMSRASVQEITTALRDLGTAGAPIIPGDPAVDVVREILGLPMQETIELDEDLTLRDKGGAEDDDETDPEDTPEDPATKKEEGAAGDGMPTNQNNEPKKKAAKKSRKQKS